MVRISSWIRFFALLAILFVILWVTFGGLAGWWNATKAGMYDSATIIMPSMVSFIIIFAAVGLVSLLLSWGGRMGMMITAIFLVVATINTIYTQTVPWKPGASTLWSFHLFITLPIAVLTSFWMVITKSLGEGFSKGVATYLSFWKELFTILIGIINVFRTDPAVKAINKRHNKKRF